MSEPGELPTAVLNFILSQFNSDKVFQPEHVDDYQPTFLTVNGALTKNKEWIEKSSAKSSKKQLRIQFFAQLADSELGEYADQEIYKHKVCLV
jgi:hypothetical protein